MNKENEFNINLSHNSYEDIPIISISNKSKSNSSSNNNKINKLTTKKKIDSLRRNNKLKKAENSHSLLNFTQNSVIPFYDKSFNEKNNLSMNNNSKSRSDKKGEITPKKRYDKNNILNEKLKNKKKDVLEVDNIHGKNLMEYFVKMRENISTEENNNNRVSSVGNKIKYSLNIKNINININKSWNKNKYLFLNTRKTANIIQRKKSINNFNNTTSIKNLQNLLSQFKININLKSLINKYRPSLKDNKIKNTDIKSDVEKEKKLSFEKIKPSPKSDYHKRKLSVSNLNLRETVMKNLFHENNNKKNNEINNINKYIRTNEKLGKIFSTQNKILPYKNNNTNINNKFNAKKINNYDEMNSFYLKYKEKFNLQKNQKQGINNKDLNNKINNKKYKK